MDQTKLAAMAANLMDAIDRDLPRDSEFGDIILIAEVRSGDDTNIVNMSTVGSRRHVAVGLLEHVKQTYLAG
jgi:hypothetical protein